MQAEISDEELKEVIGVIKAAHGYDFTNYSVASLKRRILRFLSIAGVSVYDLKYNIANDNVFFTWMLESLTVNVTEMFRDPPFYKVLRETVVPVLASYPHVRIWHAGCSTGEEAFSMAILLHEAGILDRCRIYATDMSMANLKQAEKGIIPATRMKEYTVNYQSSGGRADFSTYYSARYDNAIIGSFIRKNILFSQHNLVTDYVFNEFQLICCRNVLIYFNKQLQNHVVRLFHDSLSPLGFLALGTKESLLVTDSAGKFDVVDQKNKIFRLKVV